MNRSSRASLFVYLALMAIPAGAPAQAAQPEFPVRPLRYIVRSPRVARPTSSPASRPPR